MKRMIRITSLVLLLSGFFPMTCYAIFDPFGPLIYARQMAQMWQKTKLPLQRFQQLQNAIATAKNQLSQENTLVKDAQGHYGFGNLLNSEQDLTQDREWSPNNWQGALKGASGGNPQRYQQLVAQYKRNHPTLSKSHYVKGASQAQYQQYHRQLETNRAVSVNASYAFNTIKMHLQQVHELSAQIEKAKNTKAAVDLNSRLVAELAYIQVQELKMQTLLNQQLAQQSANRIANETARAQFNTIPKSKP